MNEITHDPDTWPKGDRVWDLARAIAYAEGANVPNSVPDRLNNPGDIHDGYGEYGSDMKDGSFVTIFPTKEIGWTWLRLKLLHIKSGSSIVYSPAIPFQGFAQKWASNWRPWLSTVTQHVGVTPSDTLSSYFNKEVANATQE